MNSTRFFKFLLLFLFFLIELRAENSVDLLKVCDESECKPKVWYLKDNFAENFLDIKFYPTADWKHTDSLPITLNHFFKKDSFFATYTLMTEFELPNIYLSSEKEMGIRFGEIGEVFSVYINGNLIAEEGITKDGQVSHHRTVRWQTFSLPRRYLKNGQNRLLLKISGDPRFDHTGLYLTRGYSIGYYDQLKYESQDRISLALILVYIVIGLYHLFLYFKRKKEIYNLYFSGFAIGAGIYFFTRSNEIFEFDWDTLVTQKIELIVLYIFVAFYFQFFSFLYFDRTTKFKKYLFYFHLIIAMLTVILPLYLCEYILRAWQFVAFTLILPSLINSLYLGVRERIPYSKNLMWATIILLASAIFDIVDSVKFHTGIAMSKYSFFIYMLGIATVLADKFSEIHRQTESLNLTLENKVKERTSELTLSLESVKELKNQQDGDYFLTSLLLRPLGPNLYKSNNLKIDFWIRQKKKFQFKQWNSEIGGDLCVTHSIILKDRLYTVFVNADAMGKSIQGAGGVLVLGSVFAALIERTKMISGAADLYPERWLKNSFLELQKVFETFDGSMFVSLVLGLADDETGVVYYINAEHPSLVLYRDGVASFLDKEMQLRKLGSITTDGHLSVRIFQLKPRDILISGSDGRDDILIRETANQSKTINEDETKFLQFVEKGKGDLTLITDLIQSFGDLTDDLSLLKIEYNPEILSEIKLINIWNDVISLYRKRDFSAAFIACEEILKYFPEETKALFFASSIKLRLGDLKDSADLAERPRLRNPENESSLFRLALILIKLKNPERAKLILSEVSKFSLNVKRIKNLQSILEQKVV